MEKFSTWRDASNGIAPFVLPVPTGDNAGGPLLLIARLFQVIFAVIRFVLFLLFMSLYFLLDGLTSILTQPWPSLASVTTSVLATLLLRPCLAICFGYFNISEEQVAARRRSSAARNPPPGPGDLILSNWSSYIDTIYLTYKYNPVFLIPITSDSSQAVSYVSAGMLGALASTGYVLGEDALPSGHTLDVIAKNARKPLVIFPEATTSNNRAILRFATSKALPSLPEKMKVFMTVLKHDGPSAFRPTVACPIPANIANPLPQIFLACTSPIIMPRHLLVRIVPSSEAPPSTSSNFWRLAADEMCVVGKLKQTNLGAEEKVSFLDYYFSKTKPQARRRERVATTKKRA